MACALSHFMAKMDNINMLSYPKKEAGMIDIVTNNVKQIGTPADEGRVYISEKAYKRIKTEGFREREVFVLMGHTESSGGKYATFVEAAIAVYDIEFEKNVPLWTNKVWNGIFTEIKENYEEMIIVGWAFRQDDFPAEPTPMLENIHREHFGGAHQLMFLMNRVEQEENFYIKKNNHLKKKSGFFVYYRMNEHTYRYDEQSDEPEVSGGKTDNSDDDRIKVSLPEEFSRPAARRGQYRQMLENEGRSHRGYGRGSRAAMADSEAGMEKGGRPFMSMIMIGAIAALVVLLGLGAGGGLHGLFERKESVPAMSTEQELIPVEKISGEWYTDK